MDDEHEPAATLDAFYAVVLSHEHGGGPLRWSRRHRAWLRREQRGDWFDWATEPVEGDVVDADEYAVALLTADRFIEKQWCLRCLITPRTETHFIAPDVLGEPEVYCVQRPAYEIVGGSGTKKHLGGPAGCQHVGPALVTGPVPGVSDHAVVGGLLYGEPLPADEVLLRDWCSICARGAWRVHEQQRSDVYRDQHRLQREHLGRVIGQW